MGIVGAYVRGLFFPDQYPFTLVYLILVVVVLWAGWRVTSRIQQKGRRSFWRSGVLAIAFAPGFFGAGHGGAIIPALFAAILVFLHADWTTPGLALGAAFLFAIGPILVTWFIIFIVWWGCVRIIRATYSER